MTYIIKSAKMNKSMTTKDPLKDEAWGNAYYKTDDCVRIEVVEPTAEETAKAELIQAKKAEISALEIKNLRKLYDGEDMTAVNAERLKLRNEIRKLEGK
jgi:hypothetical protein